LDLLPALPLIAIINLLPIGNSGETLLHPIAVGYPQQMQKMMRQMEAMPRSKKGGFPGM
jgi:hypothetical protein